MYFIKQWIGTLASPMTAALTILVVTIICYVRGHRRTARWLLAICIAWVFLAAMTPVGEALLQPLESSYPPLQDNRVPPVDFVVVLGTSYTPRDGIPITAALDQEGLTRVVEGIRLLHLIRNARLVVSGGAPPTQEPPAHGYATLARSVGVDPASLIILDKALDTNQEAHDLLAVVGASPFLLVTSASHMPRAVKLMRRLGAHPIPAPTAQWSSSSRPFTVRELLPSSVGLHQTELALHEYLGLASLAVGFE